MHSIPLIVSHSLPRLVEDRLLFERYQRDGDTASRDALLERFLPLAHHLARRYGSAGGQAEDLSQVAALGLLNAINRFDPSRGTAFSTFAVPTIVGEIKRYFRDKGWAVRVPRDLQEHALLVTREADDLERELGRVPTAAELAARSDLTIEQVIEPRLAAQAHHGVSLDRPKTEDDEADSTLGDTLGTTDPGFGQAEDAITFDRLLADLTERQRTILRLRFREELTQAEIGERIGVSQMHVSRLIRQSIEHIRASTLR